MIVERFETFILERAEDIARGILAKTSATYQLDPGRDADRAAKLRRHLYPAQLHCAAAIARRLREHPDALLTGEPSTGKTVASIAVAWMLRASRTLAVVPAHLIGKWRREILQTLPEAEVVELRRISDARAAATATCSPDRPLWALVSRDVAKLDAHWTPAVHPRRAIRSHAKLRPRVDIPKTLPVGPPEHAFPSIDTDPETGRPLVVFRCPDCYQGLGQWQAQDATWTWQWWTATHIESAIRKCPHCQAVLARRYPHDGGGAYPIARYLARYHRDAFDLAVVDEIHRHKGGDTAQGIALTWVRQTARCVIGVTATLTSGKPASIFHLLHRLSREFRKEWKYSDSRAFARKYGLTRQIWGQDADSATTGRRSARKDKTTRPRTQELPGLSPGILRYILDRTAFIRLADLRAHLPPFDERPIAVEMAPEQREGYKRVLAALKDAIGSDLRHRRGAALAAKLHTLLAWPDTPWRPMWEIAEENGGLSVQPLSEDAIYPKEHAVIDTCRREAAQDRRTLVYCVHTGEIGAAERVTRLLREAGLRTAWLQADIAPRAREDWIERRAPSLDVLVSSPRLVGEGLDLLQFPTIVWLEPEYNVYTVRQASRRSWRLGQTEPVRVQHLYYADTAQEHAARLAARGVIAAAAFDGDVAEASMGLGALAGTETVYELARLILGEVQSDGIGSAIAALEDSYRRIGRADAQAATAIDGTTLAAGWVLEERRRQRRKPAWERGADAKQTSLF